MRPRDLGDHSTPRSMVKRLDEGRQIGDVIEHVTADNDIRRSSFRSRLRPGPYHREIRGTVLEHGRLAVHGDDPSSRRPQRQRHGAPAGTHIEHVASRAQCLESATVQRGQPCMPGFKECHRERPWILRSLGNNMFGDRPGGERFLPAAGRGRGAQSSQPSESGRPRTPGGPPAGRRRRADRIPGTLDPHRAPSARPCWEPRRR